MITWPTPTVHSDNRTPRVPKKTSNATPNTTYGMTMGIVATAKKAPLPGKRKRTSPMAAMVPSTVATDDVASPSRMLLRAAAKSSLARNNSRYHRSVNPFKGKMRRGESLKEKRIRRTMGRYSTINSSTT